MTTTDRVEARPTEPRFPAPGTGAPRAPAGERARRLLGGVRVRVVAGYVLLVVLALGVTILLARQIHLSRVDRDVDRLLTQEVEELRRLVGGVNPETGEPFAGDAAAIFDTFLSRNVPGEGEAFYTLVDGRLYRWSFDAPVPLTKNQTLVARWAAVQEPTRETIETSVGEARVLAVPLLDGADVEGVFVVAIFPAEARDEALQAVRISLVVGAIVLVVSSVIAWSAAGQVIRPVRDLTRTARRITDTDLEARIPVEGHDELAELGETFNSMLDRLQAAFASQREFLDDVAHDLRTPITIVRGHLELLDDDPDERRATVALVTDELDRMGRYVNELLVLAKAGRPDFLRLDDVDFGELAQGLVARARVLAPRDWVLERAPQPGVVWGVADEERLTQAVVNLAQNAVQQTGPGDRIELSIAIEGANARLAVRDRGPGIDPVELERLFDRGARGARSDVQRPEGAGLGLAIVQAIAQAHGGWVEAESAIGAGATFTIVVPLDAGSDRPSRSDGTAP